jgi:hypothetical protein
MSPYDDGIDVFLTGEALADFVFEHIIMKLSKENRDKRIKAALDIFEDEWEPPFLAESIARCQEKPEFFQIFMRKKKIPGHCQICGKAVDKITVTKCNRCSWFSMMCERCNSQRDRVYGVKMGRKMLILHAAMTGCDKKEGTSHIPEKLHCYVNRASCTDNVSHYQTVPGGTVAVCDKHVESVTDIAYKNGEPVRREEEKVAQKTGD